MINSPFEILYFSLQISSENLVMYLGNTWLKGRFTYFNHQIAWKMYLQCWKKYVTSGWPVVSLQIKIISLQIYGCFATNHKSFRYRLKWLLGVSWPKNCMYKIWLYIKHLLQHGGKHAYRKSSPSFSSSLIFSVLLTQWSNVCAFANVTANSWHASRFLEPSLLTQITNNHASQ